MDNERIDVEGRRGTVARMRSLGAQAWVVWPRLRYSVSSLPQQRAADVPFTGSSWAGSSSTSSRLRFGLFTPFSPDVGATSTAGFVSGTARAVGERAREVASKTSS